MGNLGFTVFHVMVTFAKFIGGLSGSGADFIAVGAVAQQMIGILDIVEFMAMTTRQ